MNTTINIQHLDNRLSWGMALTVMQHPDGFSAELQRRNAPPAEGKLRVGKTALEAIGLAMTAWITRQADDEPQGKDQSEDAPLLVWVEDGSGNSMRYRGHLKGQPGTTLAIIIPVPEQQPGMVILMGAVMTDEFERRSELMTLERAKHLADQSLRDWFKAAAPLLAEPAEFSLAAECKRLEEDLASSNELAVKLGTHARELKEHVESLRAASAQTATQHRREIDEAIADYQQRLNRATAVIESAIGEKSVPNGAEALVSKILEALN